MRLNDSGNSNPVLRGEEEEYLRKRLVSSLYRYSDLSVKNIAHQVDMSLNEVQDITDELAKSGLAIISRTKHH